MPLSLWQPRLLYLTGSDAVTLAHAHMSVIDVGAPLLLAVAVCVDINVTFLKDFRQHFVMLIAD